MSDNSVSSLLSRIDAASSKLNTASDQANAVLKMVQEHLVSSQFGIEVWWFDRPIEDSVDEGHLGPFDQRTSHAKILGFAKVDREWCLAVKPIKFVSGFYEGEMDCPYTNTLADGADVSLLKSSRDLRIAAAKVLPDFLEFVVGAVAQTAEQVDESIRKVVSPQSA
jgi:hypothetical protein